MNAIRISNQIKARNTQNWVQNREVGDIVLKGVYPNRFYVTENVIGGYSQRTDLHSADGWRPYISLVDGTDYDSATQKLNTNLIVGYPIGNPIATRTHYAYKIVDLTPEEITQQTEDNEVNEAREKLDNYRFKGGEFIEQVRTKMWRRHHKLQSTATNYLTKVQIGKLDRWFQEIYNTLLVGNFRESRRLINNLIEDRDDVTGDSTLLETSGMLDTAQWFQTKIQDYFNNDYDL